MLIPMRSLKDRLIARAESELAAEQAKKKAEQAKKKAEQAKKKAEQKTKTKKEGEVVEPASAKVNQLKSNRYGKK